MPDQPLPLEDGAMPDILPIHPRTGLRAVGIAAGRPVWPIMGGSGDTPPPGATPPAVPQQPPSQPPAPVPHPPPSQPSATGTQNESQDPPTAVEQLGDAGKKALDEERRARREAEKARKGLEDQLRAIEDKDKSELERAQSRLADLEKSYAAAEAQRLRLHVATTHGVGADDLVLLTGATEEDLVAQAQRIAALNAYRDTAQAPPAFAPSLGQQAGNAAPASEKSSVARGRDMYRRRRGTASAETRR
jgi:hypothetical protein